MLATDFDPVQIDPSQACTRETAYKALAAAAQRYLDDFEQFARSGRVPPSAAVITRVRGTGPGVSFGALLAPLVDERTLTWACPFEGSENVSGAAIRGVDALHD